jgi:hypothetical protein
VGLVLALVMETALFITRANMADGEGQKYSKLISPDVDEREPRAIQEEAFRTTPGPRHPKTQKPSPMGNLQQSAQLSTRQKKMQ